jgi:class 3 adenylate cyclase
MSALSTSPAASWLRSLRTKIALAMAVVALTVTVAFIVPGMALRRKALLQDFQMFVRSAAGTTALALDGDSLAEIRSNADAQTEAFRKARTILARSREINGLSEQEIYILRPTGAPDETEFVVMLQPQTFIGDRYRVLPENRPTLTETWLTGRATSTGIYHDAHGQWISGYAPILGSDGKPVAIIEVDAEISRFVSELQNILWAAIGLGAGALLVGMLPGLWLARGITRGLNRLALGMQRFRAGDTAVQVPADSPDEIGQLSAAFNDMIEALREKLALLPYVSRFTAEAVRRSRTDPAWLTGSEQEVLVLFADIRGFTRFCEDREAQMLVRELNQMLSVQADVVISAGGDVDKFIGDAIMAVFLDATDTPEQVYACARQLLARMHREVASHGWPLALGIGIHRGRAVVGSIGSETRRDFTAIGHTVNLAARLCERAGPWEILCSEAFHTALSPASRAAFVCTEPMQFKNVQQMVTTYSCTVPVAEQAA